MSNVSVRSNKSSYSLNGTKVDSNPVKHEFGLRALEVNHISHGVVAAQLIYQSFFRFCSRKMSLCARDFC